jgi:hypothetical protein
LCDRLNYASAPCAKNVLFCRDERGPKIGQRCVSSGYQEHGSNAVAENLCRLSPALRFGVVADFCGVSVQSGRLVAG